MLVTHDVSSSIVAGQLPNSRGSAVRSRSRSRTATTGTDFWRAAKTPKVLKKIKYESPNICRKLSKMLGRSCDRWRNRSGRRLDSRDLPLRSTGVRIPEVRARRQRSQPTRSPETGASRRKKSERGFKICAQKGI
ncbi:hypothetical protein GN956_G23643 [Arapaima gigas]